jgi:hypothetical protein
MTGGRLKVAYLKEGVFYGDGVDVDDIRSFIRISQGAWERRYAYCYLSSGRFGRGIVNGEVGGSFKKNQETGFE